MTEMGKQDCISIVHGEPDERTDSAMVNRWREFTDSHCKDGSSLAVMGENR